MNRCSSHSRRPIITQQAANWLIEKAAIVPMSMPALIAETLLSTLARIELAVDWYSSRREG